MEEPRELTGDILMSYDSVSGKKTHIFEETAYLADRHVVVNRGSSTTLRFWKWLPPIRTSREEVLEIPPEITTEDALWDYVQQHRRGWLRHGRRRR